MLLERELSGSIVAESVNSVVVPFNWRLRAGAEIIEVRHKRVPLNRSVVGFQSGLRVATLSDKFEINLVGKHVGRNLYFFLRESFGLARLSFELSVRPASGASTAAEALLRALRRGRRRGRETLIKLLFFEIVFWRDASVVHLALPYVVFQYFDFLPVKRVYAVVVL